MLAPPTPRPHNSQTPSGTSSSWFRDLWPQTPQRSLRQLGPWGSSSRNAAQRLEVILSEHRGVGEPIIRRSCSALWTRIPKEKVCSPVPPDVLSCWSACWSSDCFTCFLDARLVLHVLLRTCLVHLLVITGTANQLLLTYRHVPLLRTCELKTAVGAPVKLCLLESGWISGSFT